MHHVVQVNEEAEGLRAGLERYSYLWQSDRKEMMQEFLTYGRQLGADKLEAEEAPPTLKDFQREVRHTCPGVLLSICIVLVFVTASTCVGEDSGHSDFTWCMSP